jgi:hypothetical protein
MTEPVYDAKRIEAINARLRDRNVRITYGVRDGNDYRIEDAETDMEWLLEQYEALWAYIRGGHLAAATQGGCRHEPPYLGPLTDGTYGGWICAHCGREWSAFEIEALLRAADRLAAVHSEDSPAYGAGEEQR